MGQADSRLTDSPVNSNDPATVEITVTWNDPNGSAVYCIGSFNNWSERVPLQRNHSGTWFAVLYLPPGIYQYKFIVDGNWVCAPDQPQCRDNDGNLNNVIQISSSGHLTEPANQEDARYNFRPGDSHREIDKWFTLSVPDNPRDVWKSFPSEVPKQLLKTILNETISKTDTYEPTLLLPIPEHVTLTHFFRQKRRKMITATSASIKYRSKYLTVVLYSPSDEPVNIPDLSKVIHEYVATNNIKSDV